MVGNIPSKVDPSKDYLGLEKGPAGFRQVGWCGLSCRRRRGRGVPAVGPFVAGAVIVVLGDAAPLGAGALSLPLAIPDPAPHPWEQQVRRQREEEGQGEEAGVAEVLDAVAAGAAEEAGEAEEGGEKRVLRGGLVLVADAHQE